MQKHKCKLCSKSFCNGRALGGHMKSHLVASQLATRKRLSDSPSSIHSSSSSSDGKSLGYGLRENPRKSFRVLNPDPDSSNLFLIDDKESETETEPESENPVKKRTRAQVSKMKKKKQKTSHNSSESRKNQKQKTSHNWTESLEPASSVSDGTPEQDLAMCLMMLSRDSRVPVFKGENEKNPPEKRHLPELRRCVIDLNLPPPQETEISTVLSAV